MICTYLSCEEGHVGKSSFMRYFKILFLIKNGTYKSKTKYLDTANPKKKLSGTLKYDSSLIGLELIRKWNKE